MGAITTGGWLTEALQGVTAGVQAYLIALLDTHTAEMVELAQGHRQRLANTREELPYEDSIAIYQWISEFVYTANLKKSALALASFTEAVLPWYERLAAGEPVPEAIRERLLAFDAAYTELFDGVVPMAAAWVERQRERHRGDDQVARLSAEFDRLLAETQKSTPIDTLVRR